MPEPADEDDLLQDVELQLTLEQERHQLEGWIEAAGLSGREAQMCDLDISTGCNTLIAAQEMGVSESKARDYRSRYLAKLKRAAGH